MPYSLPQSVKAVNYSLRADAEARIFGHRLDDQRETEPIFHLGNVAVQAPARGRDAGLSKQLLGMHLVGGARQRIAARAGEAVAHRFQRPGDARFLEEPPLDAFAQVEHDPLRRRVRRQRDFNIGMDRHALHLEAAGQRFGHHLCTSDHLLLG